MCRAEYGVSRSGGGGSRVKSELLYISVGTMGHNPYFTYSNIAYICDLETLREKHCEVPTIEPNCWPPILVSPCAKRLPTAQYVSHETVTHSTIPDHNHYSSLHKAWTSALNHIKRTCHGEVFVIVQGVCSEKASGKVRLCGHSSHSWSRKCSRRGTS